MRNKFREREEVERREVFNKKLYPQHAVTVHAIAPSSKNPTVDRRLCPRNLNKTNSEARESGGEIT